jgi:probable phosphoglycerate mutase
MPTRPESQARLALLRHGPTDWNREHRLQGHSDLPLGANARAALENWRLPDWTATCDWLASPLRRSIETAEILHRRVGATQPLGIEPRLIEMNYGAWEGRRLSDLRLEFDREMAELESRGLDFRAPGGESPRDVQARLRPWLAEVGANGKTTLAIAHKGIIRAVYALASGWTMTAEAPDKLRMDALQLFAVSRDGSIAVERLNLPVVVP